MSRLLASCLAFCLASSASAAVTVTLDPGTIPVKILCGQTWVESGVTLSFVDTTVDDCGVGQCIFGFLPDGVGLFPARLSLDVTGLGDAGLTVEADVTDGCGTACTRLLLYSGPTLIAETWNPDVGSYTLVIGSGGVPIDRIAVSSCEGAVYEIRISPSCPWDCQEEPDGQVGVVDFLALLATWGESGAPCDFDGGGVGVTDFLELLANWGPCPTD